MLGFLLAMSVTMALIPPLMKAAIRWNFIDTPNHRKVHSTPVPRIGGIAMAVAVLLALALSGNYSQPMPAYLAGVVVLLIFGVCDDRFTLSAAPKFAGQCIAVAIVMFWGDVGITTITLSERITLAPWFGMPLTFFFLIGVTNAINLADGLDGLAGGTTLLSLSSLALLALTSGSPFVGIVAIVIIGAILGFLRYNTHPASVFMGDGGSQILGFSAAVLALVLTQDHETPLSSALPLLLLGIPLIDTLMVMTRRVWEGRSPFQADRYHVHHRLLSIGFDHHEAVMAIYALQGVLFVTAWFLRYESDVTIVAVFGIFSLLSVGLLQYAGQANWRWRRTPPSGSMPSSAVGRLLRWLKMPQHLPYWTLMTIAAVVALYFAGVAMVCPSPSADVRVMAALLAGGVATSLVLRWHAIEAGWLDKGTLYVSAVMAVYFDRQVDTIMESYPPVQWAIFGLLVVAIVLRFRFASTRRFKITPLDVLVVFAAIAVPNLPGSIAASATLGEGIAKLIALMYAMETLLGAAARWWRLPSIAALLFLGACALRGAF